MNLNNTIDAMRIQYISIAASLCFLAYIAWLIYRHKLREEYAIVWICSTLLLVLFSIWREGLDIISHLLGIYAPPNLIFMGGLFAVLIYLLHLSVVSSRLHGQHKKVIQELALLRAKLEAMENEQRDKQDN